MVNSGDLPLVACTPTPFFGNLCDAQWGQALPISKAPHTPTGAVIHFNLNLYIQARGPIPLFSRD
jgi:hypothetical protein